MIYNKINIIMILGLFITNRSNCQEKKTSLSIGDTIPNISIPKIYKQNIKTGSISDYKNKLLILDFWGTGCLSCVDLLPKFDMLQKKFGNQVAILPVTSEKEKNVISFLTHNKITKNLALSYVLEDLNLKSLFKHQYISHEVWIYKGKVIGITYPEYIDEKNIMKVLNGSVVNWPIKYDYDFFDRNKPIFQIDTNQIDTNNTDYSYAAISDYSKRFSSANLRGKQEIIRIANKRLVRFYALNESILKLYSLNLQKAEKGKIRNTPLPFLQENQIVWNVSDSTKYFYNKKWGYAQDWLEKYGVCFESLYPDTGQSETQIYQKVISDMNRLFGLKVGWEKRREKVFVISKKINGVVVGKKELKDVNYSISDLVFILNQKADNNYIFCKPGEEDLMISIDPKSLENIIAFKKALSDHGFELIEKIDLVDKLIFSEIDGGLIIDSQMQRDANSRIKASEVVNNIVTGVKENEQFLNLNSTRPEVNTTQSGLQYKIIKQGNGIKPTNSSTVLVHYEGRLITGKIFDSSYAKGRPSIFKVKNVIPGWSEALEMMRQGDTWDIFIPAKLAYDTHTNRGTIPPNSTLIFRISLLKILN